MRNANKSDKIHYSTTEREVEKWSSIRDRITTKRQSIFQLVGPIITPSFNEIVLPLHLILHTDRQTDRQTD